MAAHILAFLYACFTLMKIKGTVNIYRQEYSSLSLNYISIPNISESRIEEKKSKEQNIIFKHSLPITILDIIFIVLIVGFAYTQDTLLISLLIYFSMRIIDKLYKNYLHKNFSVYSQ